MNRISPKLTVEQLNAVHERVYQLIQDITVADESVRTLENMPEEYGNIWHYSEIKSETYKAFAEIFGYHPGMQNELDGHRFPVAERLQPLPTTKAELTKQLEENPLRAIIADIGASQEDLKYGGGFHTLAVAADMWDSIAKQILDELPHLLQESRGRGHA